MRILDKLIRKRHRLIADEEDVINTLKSIQQSCDSSWSLRKINMTVGNCGQIGKQKWFIRFACSNEKWDLLRTELKVIRVFKDTDIPENSNRNIYTKD